MGLKYQENVTIPFDMCDVQHEIKLPAFISYCLGVSGRQSASVGRSDVFIFEEFGLIWVVTDYELNIHRLPTYNETITIVTEAIAYNKFFCHRMFYIYDENGKGENVQHTKITQNNYNGICYTKIAIFGNINNNSRIEVIIGNSIGNFENKIPLTNDKNIVIGYEYTFKHYTVEKGHIEVKIDNKLYDSKVFVK